MPGVMNKREIVGYKPSDIQMIRGDLIHAGAPASLVHFCQSLGQAIAKNPGGRPRRDGSGWTTNHRNLTVHHDRDLSTELVEQKELPDITQKLSSP